MKTAIVVLLLLVVAGWLTGAEGVLRQRPSEAGRIGLPYSSPCTPLKTMYACRRNFSLDDHRVPVQSSA
jgi:hypothetical protein